MPMTKVIPMRVDRRVWRSIGGQLLLACCGLVLVGCRKPTDRDRFLAVVAEVRAGKVTVIDQRDFPQFTDNDLAGLAGLTQLDDLNLDNCPVTDAGLAHLAELTSLRSLSLTNTRITDDGLKQLAGMHNLEFFRADHGRGAAASGEAQEPARSVVLAERHHGQGTTSCCRSSRRPPCRVCPRIVWFRRRWRCSSVRRAARPTRRTTCRRSTCGTRRGRPLWPRRTTPSTRGTSSRTRPRVRPRCWRGMIRTTRGPTCRRPRASAFCAANSPCATSATGRRTPIWWAKSMSRAPTTARQSMYTGVDLDINRWTLGPPLQDGVVSAERYFGSAHSGGCHFLFCDGSVRTISYAIDTEVHRQTGHRHDGLPRCVP